MKTVKVTGPISVTTLFIIFLRKIWVIASKKRYSTIKYEIYGKHNNLQCKSKDNCEIHEQEFRYVLLIIPK